MHSSIWRVSPRQNATPVGCDGRASISCVSSMPNGVVFEIKRFASTKCHISGPPNPEKVGHSRWSSKSLDVRNHGSGSRTIASRPGWPGWAVPLSRWCLGRLGRVAGLAIPHDTTSFTSMVFTVAWVPKVGRAVVSVVFVCRLGRVAGLASPHDTTRFTSMVFTLGGMALLDLYGEVCAPRKHGRKLALVSWPILVSVFFVC